MFFGHLFPICRTRLELSTDFGDFMLLQFLDDFGERNTILILNAHF